MAGGLTSFRRRHTQAITRVANTARCSQSQSQALSRQEGFRVGQGRWASDSAVLYRIVSAARAARLTDPLGLNCRRLRSFAYFPRFPIPPGTLDMPTFARNELAENYGIWRMAASDRCWRGPTNRGLRHSL
jgi:hypothetical protein